MSLTINRSEKLPGIPSPETLRTLERVPEMYLILSPELYILAASVLYLEATETKKEDLIGKHIFEAFPDNPAHPEADGMKNINASLQRVLRSKKPDYMPVQRYDVPDIKNPGQFIQRYWDPSHMPVLNESGEIEYIIQRANNITEQVLTEISLAKIRAEQQDTLAQLRVANDELAASGGEMQAVNIKLQHTQQTLQNFNAELEQRIILRTAELSEREAELRMALAEQVKAKEELAHTNERLTIALDVGSLGYTEVDLATGQMISNEQYKSFYGIKKDEEFTYADLFEAMLPQYREDVKRSSALARETNTLYKAVYEVAWPDGSIHWISAHARPLYNKSGTADRIIAITTDITEQKKDEQRKNDFITMVSHELKTPLTSLSAYIQMLYGRAAKDADSFSYDALAKATKQVRKMSTMINGFLNVSRLESSKMQIDKHSFHTGELLREIEEESNALVASHSLVFEPVENIYLTADKDKISQVVHNLVSNAVKYSPVGSTIRVSCTKVENTIQVCVSDKGMGIEPEHQKKIFKRFYRVKETQAHNIAGFGIGLYLCCEIIQQHGGRLWVQSELGEGSSFYFSLPLNSGSV